MRVMLIAMAIMLFTGAVCCAQGQGLVQGVKAEKRSYALGDKIHLEYAVRNSGNQVVKYSFATSKQHDVWVERGGQEVFRLSANRFYSQMMTSLTLRPGDTKTYTAEWDQKDNTGKQVGPGTYAVYAQLTPTGTAPPPATTGHVTVGIRGAALVPVTIKEAITRFDDLADRKVIISAVYKGSSPTSDANTNGGPPITRSDWAISDDTGSMYVVGKIELDPIKDSGTKISVIGKLKKTSKGQVYMMYEIMTIEKKTCELRGT